MSLSVALRHRLGALSLDVAFEAFNSQWGTTAIPITGGTVPSGASFTLGADAETTLLNANLLKSVSPKWVLAANGTKTVQTGGGCTLAWGA